MIITSKKRSWKNNLNKNLRVFNENYLIIELFIYLIIEDVQNDYR